MRSASDRKRRYLVEVATTPVTGRRASVLCAKRVRVGSWVCARCVEKQAIGERV